MVEGIPLEGKITDSTVSDIFAPPRAPAFRKRSFSAPRAPDAPAPPQALRGTSRGASARVKTACSTMGTFVRYMRGPSVAYLLIHDSVTQLARQPGVLLGRLAGPFRHAAPAGARPGGVPVDDFHFAEPTGIPTGRTRQITPTPVQGRRPWPYPRWGEGGSDLRPRLGCCV